MVNFCLCQLCSIINFVESGSIFGYSVLYSGEHFVHHMLEMLKRISNLVDELFLPQVSSDHWHFKYLIGGGSITQSPHPVKAKSMLSGNITACLPLPNLQLAELHNLKTKNF